MRLRLALLGLMASTAVAAAQDLPNTPQCRQYREFASSAGAAGTLSRLTELYNACMNSARNNPDVKKHQCGPGTYESFVGSVRRCVKS